MLCLTFIVTVVAFVVQPVSSAAPLECRTTVLGTEYRGTMNKTETGTVCQAWTSQSPHGHTIMAPDSNASNYCRNPDNSTGPWCYTVDPNNRWDYCPVPMCDIDACLSNPCVNGATCVNGASMFTCQCFPGYTGIRCEQDINECASNPCLNSGVCNNALAKYTCSCISGYSGRQCQTPVDSCGDNPCQNGATCVDMSGTYKCSCVSGYSGSNCEVDINECASNPCTNGGTCYDLVNRFKCACLVGFGGLSCQTVINTCASVPCLNGATCTSAVNKYSCTCPPGYAGFNCENVMDMCSAKPCKNGGTCVNGVNQYICVCTFGYSGANCSTPADICGSNPCLNGGVCGIGDTGYTCTCHAGYGGLNCENFAFGNGGALYVHWGSAKCPFEAELVYAGGTGAGHYSHAGSGMNYQCMPFNPQWNKFVDGLQGVGAHMYGAEYQTTEAGSESLFSFANSNGLPLQDHDVPCAVCNVPSRPSVLMIPAMTSCPSNWTMEYTGYLMSMHYAYQRNTWACVDASPETILGGYLDQNGALFYPTQAVCGSLKCPNYVQGRELTCAVCTR